MIPYGSVYVVFVYSCELHNLNKGGNYYQCVQYTLGLLSIDAKVTAKLWNYKGSEIQK